MVMKEQNQQHMYFETTQIPMMEKETAQPVKYGISAYYKKVMDALTCQETVVNQT